MQNSRIYNVYKLHDGLSKTSFWLDNKVEYQKISVDRINIVEGTIKNIMDFMKINSDFLGDKSIIFVALIYSKTEDISPIADIVLKNAKWSVVKYHCLREITGEMTRYVEKIKGITGDLDDISDSLLKKLNEESDIIENIFGLQIKQTISHYI
jgi:hypothetical protein